MKSFLKKIVSNILIWESKRVIKKYKPKVVAVTGSVGKTVTKDAIYTLISHFEYTRKSEKSFNSELGVPLTVLGMPNAWSSFVGWVENIGEGLILPLRGEKYPNWLVLEVGVDRPGDIDKFSWLKPDVVVFTRFPKTPVHVEYFESPEQVIEEKRKLKEYLKPEGALVVNLDDARMADEKVKEGQSKISYGFSESATLRAFDYEVLYKNEMPAGIAFKVKFQDK
jgi:UDP-N-acetylmuramoyl-tripeptide--D-alanyl-D-alanine ligase